MPNRTKTRAKKRKRQSKSRDLLDGVESPHTDKARSRKDEIAPQSSGVKVTQPLRYFNRTENIGVVEKSSRNESGQETRTIDSETKRRQHKSTALFDDVESNLLAHESRSREDGMAPDASGTRTSGKATNQSSGPLKSDESGLEEEQSDSEEIIEPFDPEKIKIRTMPLLVSHLVTRVKFEEIDLQPDFQRLRGIWKSRDQSRLIESLMLRIPIPVFYVSADEEDNWSVVDGVQRMSTICDFVNDKFSLTSLEYLKRYDDHEHSDLPRSLQRRISETQLTINVIEPGTPTEVMFNIFTRINTGGTQLNAQEIRHAVNPGQVREFLKKLASSPEFKDATDNSINSKRMADRECVLRFLAFRVTPPEQYNASKLDDFLMEAMEKINSMQCSERKTLAEDFTKSMCAAHSIFGDNAFRKPRTEKSRFPINKALVETWSVQLADCSQDQIDKLIEKHEDVQKQFAEQLQQDDEFDDAISQSTSDPKRIRKRFRTVSEIVKEVVNAP